MSGYVSTDPSVRVHRRSHLASWQRCPARFRAEAAAPSAVSANEDALQRGTAFHDCVESILLAMAGRKQTTPQRSDVEAALAVVPRSVREEVGVLIEGWLAGWPPVHVIDVERLMSSFVLAPGESPDGREHRIGGRIDLATHPSIIWDWKTAWYVPTQSEIEADLQVLSYAVMASDHYGWESVTVAVSFVRWGVVRHVTYDVEALNAAAEKLKTAVLGFLAWEAEMTATATAEPRPGRHCAGCPLLSRCDVASPDVIRSSEDATVLATRLALLEKQGPRLREMLRDYLAGRPGSTVSAADAEFRLDAQQSRPQVLQRQHLAKPIIHLLENGQRSTSQACG